MEKLLNLLEKDCTLSTSDMAKILNMSEEEIKKEIAELEENKTILNYSALIDWDKTQREYVTALIEVKVAPHKLHGFDNVATRIYNYPEVKSVYLMSGGFDIAAIIEGKTLRDVAFFVSKHLAPMEEVTATATHFVLRKYKDKGVIFEEENEDRRGFTQI